MANLKRNPGAGQRQGFARGMVSQAVSSSEDKADLALRQAAFVAARFNLSAERARLVAELAWGRP